MLSSTDTKNKQIVNAMKFFINHKNISITKCANKFNINRQTLSRHLSKINELEDRRAYKVNESFFDVIDTEQKAYWLGFLTADGYINKHGQVGLAISEKDITHVEKYKKDIMAEHPIKIEKNNKSVFSNNSGLAVIKIENKHLYQSLISHGFAINKTMKETPANIPNDLIRHYIRGIFDGDGWFSTSGYCHEIGFGMGKDILEYIKNIFELKLNVKKYAIRQYKTIFKYRITSKKEIDKILNFFYQDATVFLERKYKKYLEYSRLKSMSEEDLRLLSRD